MYCIETKILLRVLGRSRRWLYNQAHGYYDRNMKYHFPTVDKENIFVCLEGNKRVSYITQNGIEQIIGV